MGFLNIGMFYIFRDEWEGKGYNRTVMHLFVVREKGGQLSWCFITATETQTNWWLSWRISHHHNTEQTLPHLVSLLTATVSSVYLHNSYKVEEVYSHLLTVHLVAKNMVPPPTLCVCLCVRTHACACCIPECKRWRVYKPEVDMEMLFLDHFYTSLWDGAWTWSSSSYTGWPSSSPGPTVSTMLGLQALASIPAFYNGFWGFKLRPINCLCSNYFTYQATSSTS